MNYTLDIYDEVDICITNKNGVNQNGLCILHN